MPSLVHEALLKLFRDRPSLAPELLDALHVEVPAYDEIRSEDAKLTEIVPTEYEADLLVLLIDGEPVLAIVVEVQLSKDPRKMFTWPVYATNVRARYECRTCVLVVTPNADVAAWAGVAIDVGPGATVMPLVAGPASIPIVRDVEVAKREPELAVLSAMAHGREPQGLDVVQVVLQAVGQLDPPRLELYADLIWNSLGDAARAAMEALMTTGRHVPFSAYAKELQAEGQAKGRIEGRAAAVLDVLEARGLVVRDEERERILGCKDEAVLDGWVRKSVTVGSTAELFGER